MKIAVTGATGFLGKYVVKDLISKHYQVQAVGRNLSKKNELKKMGAEFVHADISTRGVWEKELHKADVLIHCAGLSTVWARKSEFYQANVIGTKNILRACKNIKKVIHISSPSIYTEAIDKFNISEDSILPKKFINDYAWSKKFGELELESWADENRIPSIIIRPQAIIGPEDPAIFPRIFKILNKGFFPVLGSGITYTDITAVENVVHSIILSLNFHPKNNVEIFNITNGSPVNIYEIVNQLANEFGIKFKMKKMSYLFLQNLAKTLEFSYRKLDLNSEPLLTSYSANLLRYSRTLNIEKAERLLAYKPIISLDEAITKFIKTKKSFIHD